MGCWGYDPFQSDKAGDWSDDLCYIVRDGIASQHPEVARAAAATMVAMGWWIVGEDDVGDALDQMRALFKDKKYTGNWASPKKIKKALRAQIADLKALRRQLRRRSR